MSLLGDERCCLQLDCIIGIDAMPIGLFSSCIRFCLSLTVGDGFIICSADNAFVRLKMMMRCMEL